MSMFRELLINAQHTELNYLQSSRQQAINTGIIPTNLTTVEIDFELVLSMPTTFDKIFGSFSGNDWFALQTDYYRSTRFDTPVYNNSAAYYSFSSYSYALNTRYKIKQEHGNVLYIDDVLQNNSSSSTPNFTGILPMYVFALNLNSAITQPCAIKLYGLKIWDNADNLVRNYIPVLKEGIPCLFDKTNKTYNYNIGTGEFLYG